MKKNKNGDDIIDINELKLSLSILESGQIVNKLKDVPEWDDFYVFRSTDLVYANKDQKEFYYQFKKRFKQNEFVNIKHQNNYAFVLFFELLDEYTIHNDIHLLQKQFNLLARICLQTKKYSDASLRALISKRNDFYAKQMLDPNRESQFYPLDSFDSNFYKLGRKYKDILNLSKQESAWLNKFDFTSNVFNSIEGCKIAVMKQYTLTLKLLNQILNKDGKSINKEIIRCRVENKNKQRFYNENVWVLHEKNRYYNSLEKDLYYGIFKRVENSVRADYGIKRKITDTLSNSSEITEKLINISGLVDKIILENEDQITKPDKETQIKLNETNVNRWKAEFNAIKDSFNPSDISKFIEEIDFLESVNEKNPNIKNILYETAKFIAKYNPTQALIYYAKYIIYDLKSKNNDYKQLPQAIQKSLFKSADQLNEFEKIIRELLTKRNLERAIDELSLFYIPKRKKIIIDAKEVKEVETKHSGTLELLNNILADEGDLVRNTTTATETEIGHEDNKKQHNNKFQVALSNLQVEVIERIASNSYQLSIKEVEELALENNLFKNQLIDSINEAFAEILDGEVLIEEDDEFYVMEKSFYEDILGE